MSDNVSRALRSQNREPDRHNPRCAQEICEPVRTPHQFAVARCLKPVGDKFNDRGTVRFTKRPPIADINADVKNVEQIG